MDYPGEKLLVKMWETLVQNGIGSLLTPWHVKRVGKARNEVRHHELLMLAQAERDVADIRSGRTKLLVDECAPMLPMAAERAQNTLPDGRIEPWIDFDSLAQTSTKNGAAAAAQREINVSKAVLSAERELEKDSGPIPEKSVDQDWLSNWRDSAEKVSSEELQQLWGKILAGEVKSPGRYSLRT
jgi:hypothetical protein